MVACTFVSAPLTFVSARMVSLSSANPADYITHLDDFLMRVAVVGLVCTVTYFSFGLPLSHFINFRAFPVFYYSRLLGEQKMAEGAAFCNALPYILSGKLLLNYLGAQIL